MEEMLHFTSLYDYYSGLLSDKEREYFEDYYFENLSLQEIADNNKVSKNAVSKSLLATKDKLNEYESILQLLAKKDKIRTLLTQEEFYVIEDYI